MKKDNFRLPKTYAIVKCKCGEQFRFHNNFPAICNYCGRKVYPTKLLEFKEKIKKTLIKKRSDDVLIK